MNDSEPVAQDLSGDVSSGHWPGYTVCEATIADLRTALADGVTTSVGLVAAFLDRIAAYDRQGIRLNAVPILNEAMFAEAQQSDERRRRGKLLSALDGIPYPAKASFACGGLPFTAGSPAFQDLVARKDAFAIEQLRQAGAILIGLTNMPPIAVSGYQNGLFGPVHSPYSEHYLPAPYASGSSNGAGVATAASFAAFGLGEETWSSGRGPASYNGLVAYTPSRGMISTRGNWALVPTMDTVVPLTRTVDDMLAILPFLVVDDPEPEGDLWRSRQAVKLPPLSAVRPKDYGAIGLSTDLRGKRFGVPRMYINRDAVGTRIIETRRSVIELWEVTVSRLEALGAEIVEVDFPAVSNNERDRPGTATMAERGLVPQDFARTEQWDLLLYAWDRLLRDQGAEELPDLSSVTGDLILPKVPGILPARYPELPPFREAPDAARRHVPCLDDIRSLDEGLRGLEETRRIDVEAWMDTHGLDALIFPAVADVAARDTETNPESNRLAWRNGTAVANGNQSIRHLGLPTVTITMGIMPDTAMPVGVTIAGRGYDDTALLGYARILDRAVAGRRTPPRTPALDSQRDFPGVAPAMAEDSTASGLDVTVTTSTGSSQGDGSVWIDVECRLSEPELVEHVNLHVDGRAVKARRDGQRLHAAVKVSAASQSHFHSRWRAPYGSLVTVVVADRLGRTAGAFATTGGS